VPRAPPRSERAENAQRLKKPVESTNTCNGKKEQRTTTEFLKAQKPRFHTRKVRLREHYLAAGVQLRG
jgi:hypothetical protein